jgi:hypothetical protein
MEGTRLPRLGLARLPFGNVDDRLNEGYEELRTRRVLEVARAFRDGEALAPQKRVLALFPRSDERRAVASRSTVKYTQLESLDEEIRRTAEKEKQMQTQDKVFTVVHDRRTKKTLMLAQTVTRLPKLDLSRVHGKQGHAQAHTERREAKRRGEKHQAEGKAEKKEHHGMYKGVGPHTDRPRGAQAHGVQEHESPAAVKKAPAKASAEVTEWKRQSKKQSHPRIEPERSRALKLPRGTWRQRVAGATASEETTEWKGLTKVHKLQQSWLNSETEFRALLASFGANSNYTPSNQSCVCGGESQSFFLTSSSPAPNAASKDLVERDGDSSENEERMNGMTVSKRRLTIVAPTISLDDSDDDNDDNAAQELVEASQLRAQARQVAAFSYAEKQQHAAEPEALAPTASDTIGGTEQTEDAEVQIDTNSRGDASEPPAESTIATEPLANGMNLDVKHERNGALAAYMKLRSAKFQHAETDSESDPGADDDVDDDDDDDEEEEEEEEEEALSKAKAVYEVDEEEQADAACEEAKETPEFTAPLKEEEGRNPRQETLQCKQEWAPGIGEQVSSISNLLQSSPPRNREAHAHLPHSDSPSANQSRSAAPPFGTSNPEVDMPTGAQEAGKVRLESMRHGKMSASSECSRVHPPPGVRSCLALISTSAPARSALLPPPHPGPGARSCLAFIATSGEGCVQPCPSSSAQV